MLPTFPRDHVELQRLARKAPALQRSPVWHAVATHERQTDAAGESGRAARARTAKARTALAQRADGEEIAALCALCVELANAYRNFRLETRRSALPQQMQRQALAALINKNKKFALSSTHFNLVSFPSPHFLNPNMV